MQAWTFCIEKHVEVRAVLKGKIYPIVILGERWWSVLQKRLCSWASWSGHLSWQSMVALWCVVNLTSTGDYGYSFVSCLRRESLESGAKRTRRWAHCGFEKRKGCYGLRPVQKVSDYPRRRRWSFKVYRWQGRSALSDRKDAVLILPGVWGAVGGRDVSEFDRQQRAGAFVNANPPIANAWQVSLGRTPDELFEQLERRQERDGVTSYDGLQDTEASTHVEWH